MRTALRNVVAVLVVALGLRAVEARAQIQVLGDVSFAVPQGFSLQRIGATNAAVLTAPASLGDYHIFVFPAAPAGSDIRDDLASNWRRYLSRKLGPPPAEASEYREVGYQGVFTVTTYDVARRYDDSGYAFLYVLQAHGSVIPVAVFATKRAGNSEGLDRFLHGVVHRFLNTVRVTPDRALAMKDNIQLDDLVGEWHEQTELDATISYAHSTTYTIHSDGTFESNWVGLAFGTAQRATTAGRIDLTNGLLVLRENGKPSATQYRIISFDEGLDGAAVLTLLPPGYEPYPANISLNGERWHRRPASSR